MVPCLINTAYLIMCFDGMYSQITYLNTQDFCTAFHIISTTIWHKSISKLLPSFYRKRCTYLTVV